MTVFVPSAPTPAAGAVFILPVDRIQRLDVAVADASKAIMRLVVGSQALLEGRVSASSRPESPGTRAGLDGASPQRADV